MNTTLIALLLLISWLEVGKIGFKIYHKKLLKANKSKLATAHMFLNMQILLLKNRFVILGPIGLFYALKYKNR